MGTAIVGGYSLTSVVQVTAREVKKILVEHPIPGTASIMQANGRVRDTVKIAGILNPTSEITAVQNIAAIPNSTPISVSAVTDVAGTDWPAYLSNTYFLQSVRVTTQPGATVPWGRYEINLVEVA